MRTPSIDKKRRIVQIAITERCNLNCVYCYERAKDLAILPIAVAKEHLLKETKSLDGFDEFEVDFHGGEPMLAFDTIREIAEWIWSRPWPKPYICYATTNGTLVHGDIKEWFRKNSKRFVLGLSLDGTKAQHDANRSDSYDKIDFAFFRDTWPFQGVKATVSPASIHDFADGVKHIVELGFKYSINLAYGMQWSEDLLPVYREELQKVAEFYLENPDLEPPSLFAHIVSRIGADSRRADKQKKRKWCGTGTAMSCLAPDGKTYPCQAFMPSSGMEGGSGIASKIDFADDVNFRDPHCIDCICDSACPSCYGNNYLRTGTLFSRDKSLCKFRRVEAVAASWLYGMMLQDPEKYPTIAKMKPSEKLAVARGVKLIQETLADEVEAY